MASLSGGPFCSVAIVYSYQKINKHNIWTLHWNNKDETPCTVILDTLKRIHVLNLHLDQTWCPGWRSEPASLSRCTKFILLFMWLIAIVLLVLSRHFAWTPHLCGLAGKDIEMARFLISSTNFSAHLKELPSSNKTKKHARDDNIYVILLAMPNWTQSKSYKFVHLSNKNNCVMLILSDLKLAFTSDLWKHTSIQTTGLTVFVLDSDHIQFISGLDSS